MADLGGSISDVNCAGAGLEACGPPRCEVHSVFDCARFGHIVHKPVNDHGKSDGLARVDADDGVAWAMGLGGACVEGCADLDPQHRQVVMEGHSACVVVGAADENAHGGRHGLLGAQAKGHDAAAFEERHHLVIDAKVVSDQGDRAVGALADVTRHEEPSVLARLEDADRGAPTSKENVPDGGGMARIDSPYVADRVQHFPESVIRSMSVVAAKHGAINLGQGFPDFDPPQAIMDAAKKAIDEGYNQYAVTWGAPVLREGLSRKLKSFNKIDAGPDENIVVTCGATEAMMATMLATINPGDEVVLFEPFYENFGPDAIVSGASAQYVALDAPDFQPDEEALKAAMARNPKAVVVNTPGNPTGRIFTDSTLRLIADLCADHDVLAFTDEIYEHMVYDGKHHTSLATVGDMHDRTVTIGGFSKTYSVTGWRLAYTAASKPLTDAIKRVHDFLTVGAAHPLQIAGAAALELPSSYYAWLRETYQSKRDMMLASLEAAGFQCHRPDSAYYILADITDFGMSDTAFSMWLTKEVGVTCIPGSSFYADGGGTMVRFAYPKKEETLQAAADRLGKMQALLA